MEPDGPGAGDSPIGEVDGAGAGSAGDAGDGSPPPVIVYDDDCGFCTRTAELAARHGDFELVGFSELGSGLRARLPDDYERCSHLLTDDAVYSCGASTEAVIARLDHPTSHLARAFRALPGREPVREGLYRLVADNRSLFGKLF